MKKTLAWHETLELHEITAFKAVGLMKVKMGIKHIEDPTLKKIYQKAITNLETSIGELLRFYPQAPKPGESEEYRAHTAFYAADLLVFTKAEIRNYAIAITETATPQLRDVFQKHLNTCIDFHEQIFAYMYQKGLYPSYNLAELLQTDVTLAHKALSM